MSVAGQYELESLLGRNRKNIRIVREKQVQNSRRDKLLGAYKIGKPRPLMIDPDQVDLTITEPNQAGFLTKEVNPSFPACRLCVSLSPCVSLMISHTPPNSGI